MALSLNQLRVFHAVTRSGSFIRAAERLSVTPPAVSLQIRQLEGSCGVTLFERVGRRIRLTAAGETLQAYAARIFTLAADAERALEHSRSLASGRLRFVASGTAATYYLPPLWTVFAQRYPGIHIHVQVENSRGVIERLANLDGDVGLLGGEPHHADLTFVPFADDPLVAVTPPRPPWKTRRTITLRELSAQRLIVREPGSAIRALLERHLAALDRRLEVAMEIASNEVIKRAVEAGNGISVMSAALVRREVESGHLCALRLTRPALRRTLHLAYHREREQSTLIQAVLAMAAAARPRAPRFRPASDRRPARSGQRPESEAR